MESYALGENLHCLSGNSIPVVSGICLAKGDVIMGYRKVGALEQMWYAAKWWLKHRKDDVDAP